MSSDLTRHLNSCTFAAIDFETTGLSAVRDRIIEIGAFRFRLDQPAGQKLNPQDGQSYSRLVHPGMSIPEQVIEIHGITDLAVADAPSFAALAPELLSFVTGTILLAHHAAFDIAFFTCELRRAGIEPEAVLVLDTYHLARKVFPNAPSFKLGSLLEHLNLEMEGRAHRALPDSLACARLFEACLAQLADGTATSLAELIRLYPQCRVGMADISEGHPAQISLQTAIREQQDVLIEYRNARNETLERRISPILLGGYGRFSYVEAYCHLRQENRQFRIDRIQKVGKEVLTRSI